MDINEAKNFLENRINPNMVSTVLRAAEEEGEKHALPSGGEVGDVLKKTTDGAEWAEETKELPSGGNANDVLTKTANGVEWKASSGGNIDYSTTEQDTGMKWVDGKSIFQRTFQGSVNTSTSGSSQETLFTISGVDKMPKMEGFFEYSGRQYPLNFSDNDYRFSARYQSGSVESTCKSYEGYKATFNITCFYTKTA